MIDVRHLYHDYERKGDYAVEDVTFHIDKGSIFGFLGPSGAGKSTVQNIMTGLLLLQKGEVLLNGISVTGLKRNFFQQNRLFLRAPQYISETDGV